MTYIDALMLSLTGKRLLGDKMPRTVGFVNCFLRDFPLACLSCKSAGSGVATQVKVSENSLQNLLYKVFCQFVYLLGLLDTKIQWQL